MSFGRATSFFSCLFLMGVLASCGGEEPPVVTAASTPPAPETVQVSDDARQVEDASQDNLENTDQTVTPLPDTSAEAQDEDTPVVEDAETEITKTDGESTVDRDRQQTIKSIIEQLELRDQKARLEDNSTAISEGLTSKTLRSETSSSNNKVVWSIDAGANTAEPVEEVKIPEGRDPSLASEALAAAFALVRDHTAVSDTLVQKDDAFVNVIAKPAHIKRAAILAPLEGRAKSIGREMQYGAELAMFTLGNDKIDLTFHDTADGINLAMNAAMLQNPDVIIGPLFAQNTKQAKPIAQVANVPILSFSNDSSVAGQGAWLFGQTPEQEIETVLLHALDQITPIADAERDKLSIGLVVQDNTYGRRISQHAVDLLISRGDVSAEMLTLNTEVLDSEDALRKSIKNLTKWLPPSSEGESRPPRFDIVLIAGDVSFALRVAPVLSWYDLDPNKVKYLGTSQWATAAILQEPSLEGSWFASQPAAAAEQFQSLWAVTNPNPASSYAMMAFDAVALVSTLDPGHPNGIGGALTDGPGFNGFSGPFKLVKGGQNIRPLEIRQIKANGFDVIVPAKTNF